MAGINTSSFEYRLRIIDNVRIELLSTPSTRCIIVIINLRVRKSHQVVGEKSLFSDRNGREKGYSTEDLIAIVWDNTQEVVQRRGLLDEQYGYIPSQWGGDNLGPAADELQKGVNVPEQSRVWLNRALKVRADFVYNPYRGNFSTDGYSQSHLPSVLDDDIDNVFDFLESLHAIVSAPKRIKNKIIHTGFNKNLGQQLLREAINDDLALYTPPYKMLENGQIVLLDGGTISELVDEGLKLKKSSGVKTSSIDALHQSVYHYMKRSASLADKKAALKEVADSLESLRPKVKESLLSDDERDLFNIANNFAIRHQNSKQKSDYDLSIWYDWMFQVNLAALITVIKTIQNQEQRKTKAQ